MNRRGARARKAISFASELSGTGVLKPLQFLPERRDGRPCFRVVLGKVAHQHPDAPHALVLLRPRRERPGDCRAAEKSDELSSSHSPPPDQGPYRVSYPK